MDPQILLTRQKFILSSLIVLGSLNQPLLAKGIFDFGQKLELPTVVLPKVKKVSHDKKIVLCVAAFAGLAVAGTGFGAWIYSHNAHAPSGPVANNLAVSPYAESELKFSTYAKGALSPYSRPESGMITHIGTNEVRNKKGVINISRPSASVEGDLLVLFLHRTDDDLPLYIDGWERVAECYKSKNRSVCATEKDCTKWHNDDFCKRFGMLGNGHDLAQAVFVRPVRKNEPKKYRFNLNRDRTGKPGWAMLTALRGADTENPVRDWAHTGCDRKTASVFPSVYGEQGDLVLLSQSFDDAIGQANFLAPAGATTLGYVSAGDEAGFLFGGYADETGETGTMVTRGNGGPACKDALISLSIRPAN
ncbi:MAG: hypothetical protein HRU09_19880 [Oligoflexales bacterium]|nr:hypothetical protein [Oligoflexales bacterium]